MAKFVPLSTPEQNNPTNLFVSIGAGLVSGLIKTVEGVVSLGAELVDLGADSNTAGQVEQFFDDINIFEDEAQDRVAGRLVEVFTQIGLPAGAGAKLATKLADKAIKAKKTGKYANLKSKNVLSGANKARELNLRVDGRLGLKPGTTKRFSAGVFGGAAGETLVADVEEIGTFGDFFDGPTALDTTETEGREEAGRRLLNRLKFGTESLFITPFVFGAGKAGKALATRGQELAYSNSVIDRWINKYIRSPFQPQGDLGPELFASETAKAGLKARDTFRAEELVNNITKEVNNIYPKADKFFDSSTKEEQKQFYKKLNDVLFEGDLKDPVNPKALDEIVKFLDDKKVSKESTQNIVGNLNAARQEFTNLISILERNTEGKISAGAKDLQKIMKDRVEGWLGGTYRIFEKPAGITKLFRSDPYTDEAYTRAINLFRRYLQKTDPNAKRDADGNLLVERNELNQLIPQGDDYFQEAKFAVDDAINQVKLKKKPGGLPDVTYQNKTAMTKTKSFEKAVGKGSKVFRQLFGEIEDPRYSIFNAMTNLSAVARTAAYFDDVLAKNAEVQSKGGRGFFWDTEELAKQAVNSPNTGIEIVPMSDVIQKLPGRGAIVTSLNNKFTTKEIADAIKNANDVGGGLTAAIRGREGANPAEKAATWFYRNLLLFPKAISQLAKTVLSIPTHLRNFFSAGAFSGANGVLFENPALLAKAFSEGINTSALLKLGRGSAEAQAAYRELLELGVVNSQVQIGDLINLLKDATGNPGVISTDSILRPFLNTFKRIGKFAQGKYVAEDDTFKITNYVVELDRIKKGAVKQGIIESVDNIPPDILRSLKQQAADIVKNTVPNYAFVGSAVKTARILPIGNFMSFPAEIIRTTTNIAEQGIKEMKHSRPTRGSNITPYVTDLETGQLVKNDNVMYGTGIKRLLGMATTLTVVPTTVVEGARFIYDVSEEEIDALRRFVPEWSKNSTLVPIRTEDGGLRYIDFSHSNAYDVIARPFRTLVNNLIEGEQNDQTLLSGFVDGVTEASAEIMNPFISESIWTEATADIVVRGGRTKEGRLLYTDQTSAGNKAAIRFLHLGQALAPSYRQFQRLGQAAFGTPTKRGDELTLGPELLGFMGLRPIKVDPLDSMGFKIAEYQGGIRNARREFTGGYFGILRGGRIKPNDVIQAYYNSNRARFLVQQEMNKNISAASILGVNTSRLKREFKDRQISDATFNSLAKGKFQPYFPSADIQERFREIARDLGDPNVFLEVRPTLKLMEREFRSLPLTGAFDSDINDFLEEDSILPELPTNVTAAQPVVAGQVNTAQTGQTNELTPTEQALLSPSEQIIRLRDKNRTV
jgi:hypothetical protein